MSRERIEVDIQAITGEKRNAERRPGAVARSGSLYAPCSACEDRAEAPEESWSGIDGQPEPQNLLGTAEPGAPPVQLEVWEMEMESAEPCLPSPTRAWI